MARALVVGTGQVGTRVARQLVDTPGVEEVLLAGRDPKVVEQLLTAFGGRARAVSFAPGDPIPADADVVVTALPAEFDHAVVAATIERGVPAASCSDEHETLDQLRSLATNAERAGTTVAIGCGLAPGLADVLARHAASLFDTVDEIRIARTGWGGPACVATARHERRALVLSWHDGGWREDRPQGEVLVWFPEPIGARDCRPVTGSTALLVDAFPDAARLGVQIGEPPPRGRFRRRGLDPEWGAARVEVRGRRSGGFETVVYGVVERTGVAAGVVLGVTALRLAGVLGDRLEHPGVHGLAALVEPVSFLAEIAERGVRAAVFEGLSAG